MTLIEQIKADSLHARKAKDAVKASLLVTLYAEASKEGKDAGNRPATDEEVIKTVRKFLKGLEESLQVLPDGPGRQQAQLEKDYLQGYLPRQVQGDALAQVLQELVQTHGLHGPQALGLLMKLLKERLPGAYDGAEASRLAKSVLGA